LVPPGLDTRGVVEPSTVINEMIFTSALSNAATGSARAAILAEFRDLGLCVMIQTLAGPFAQARHTKKSVLILGGDLAKADDIVKLIEPDAEKRHELHIRAEDIARRFMRQPCVWARVQAVAEALVQERSIDCSHPLISDIVQWQPLTQLDLQTR
jgi:hypothetical protein